MTTITTHIHKLSQFVKYIIAAISYTLLNVAWFYKALFYKNTIIGLCPSSGCDSIQFIWGQKWLAYALEHHINFFYTNWINWPIGVNGMWQTWSIANALVIFPLEFIFKPIKVYNFTVVLIGTLNCFSFFYLATKLLKSNFIPFFLGLWWGFSPYFAQEFEGHENLATAFLLPFMFYIVFKLLFLEIKRPYLSGTILGLLASYQYLNGVELLLSMAMIFILFVALYLLMFSKLVTIKRIITSIKTLLTALISFAVIALYPIYVELYGTQRIKPPLHPVEKVDLAPALLPAQYTFLGRAGFTIPKYIYSNLETATYIGLLFFIVLFVLLFKSLQEKLIRIFAIIAFVSFTLSLGPELIINKKPIAPLPWALLDKIEPFRSMLPSRLSIYFLFFGILAIGLSVKHLSLIKRPHLRYLYIAAISLSAIEMAPVVPYFSYSLPQPTFFFTRISQLIKPGQLAFVVPYARDGKQDVAPMLWQADSNMRFKMIGGYALVPNNHGKVEPVGGWPPTGLILATEQILTGGKPPVIGKPVNPIYARASFTNFLNKNHFVIVIVGPSKNEASEIKYLTKILKRKPIFSGGIYYWLKPF